MVPTWRSPVSGRPDRRSSRFLRLAAFAVLQFGCDQWVVTEEPRPTPPPHDPAIDRVVISRVVPDGCTMVGEVAGVGSATDDPSQAASRARDLMRIRAHAMGANYVLLEMQTEGPTSVEGHSEGGPNWFGGGWTSESSVTANIEVALWGTAFSCPESMLPAAPSPTAGGGEGSACRVHSDCPPQQFCAPPGICRRP